MVFGGDGTGKGRPREIGRGERANDLGWGRNTKSCTRTSGRREDRSLDAISIEGALQHLYVICLFKAASRRSALYKEESRRLRSHANWSEPFA